MNSGRFELKVDDWQRWAKNALKFLLPALLLFMGALKTGTPLRDALWIAYLYLFNVVYDLLNKWVSDNK